MKIYKVEWDSSKNGKYERTGFTTTNFDMIARYLLDRDERPEEYKNFTLHVGELEEIKVEDLDMNTIEKLF